MADSYSLGGLQAFSYPSPNVTPLAHREKERTREREQEGKKERERVWVDKSLLRIFPPVVA